MDVTSRSREVGRRMRWLRLVSMAILVIGVLCVPQLTGAQVKVYRIAVLGNENTPPWEGFRQGMRELGYVDGGNVRFEWRWSEGKTDRLPSLAAELVTLKPDVIVASGTQAVRAAKQATSTIPIVMPVSAYPERIGLVDSLARPGGNVTGLSNVSPELNGKRLELLKEIRPGGSRLAIIYNPESPVEALALREMQSATSAAGMEVLLIEVKNPEDFAAAFDFKGRQLIADFAIKQRLPSIFGERLFVEAGGLLSYAPSFTDLFRRAATFVDRILKGAKPADLPVQQPTKFDLVVNIKTARLLGLTIPPSVRLRADQTIE